MGFKLVRTDTAEPCKIQLPLGKHLIGRGKLLDCEDKRVSRNHGELEVIDDKVIIKALHQNPCFLIKKGIPETQILNHNCASDISNGDKFGLLPDSYWFELLYCVDIDNETKDHEPIDTTAPVKQEPNEDASSEKTENMSGDDGDNNDHDCSEVLDLNLNETLENNVPVSPSLLGTECEQATQQYTSEKSAAKHSPDQNEPPAESNVPNIKQDPEDSTSPPKRPHSPEDGSDDAVKKIKTELETRQDPDNAQAGPSNDQKGSNSGDNKDQKLQPPSTTAPGRERCIYGENCYRIDDEQKYRILHLRHENMNITDISNEMGVSRSTVYRWIERWEVEGRLTSHVTTGRPRLTSAEVDSRIVARARSNHFVNTGDLRTEFGVSQSTIRRRFREVGLNYRIPAKKPVLTPHHKALRLEFARNYLNYNFDNVAFLDEKVFCSSTVGRLSLYRPNNTRYHPQNVLPNNRSGRITLGFWGWICGAGPGELIEIGERLNSLRYREILEEVLLPTARVFFPGQVIIFVQDGSAIHNARVVQWYLRESPDFQLITLPPHSPDLNPIENVWGLLTQGWDHTLIRNTDNLRAHVVQLWENLRGDNFCANVVRSMRRRLSDVIAAEGGYARF